MNQRASGGGGSPSWATSATMTAPIGPVVTAASTMIWPVAVAARRLESCVPRISVTSAQTASITTVTGESGLVAVDPASTHGDHPEQE